MGVVVLDYGGNDVTNEAIVTVVVSATTPVFLRDSSSDVTPVLVEIPNGR